MLSESSTVQLATYCKVPMDLKQSSHLFAAQNHKLHHVLPSDMTGFSNENYELPDCKLLRKIRKNETEFRGS
jgi:hypothetical protein